MNVVSEVKEKFQGSSILYKAGHYSEEAILMLWL